MLQKPGEVLVHQELYVSPNEAFCPRDGSALQVPLPVCHLQVALIPAQAGLLLLVTYCV